MARLPLLSSSASIAVKFIRSLLLLPVVLMLSGCHLVLLNPSGDVARQQSELMISSVILMCLIIVPVLIAIGVIAWRYRASNKNMKYEPEWDHSSKLELMVWAGPLLIIIALGAMTWIGTHQLDPYRPLSRVSKGQTVTANTQPLQVEVVSLPWKWLFFYPKYGIATVNELAAPVNVPIQFHLTSSTMMDSFFIPAMSGQIYTMPGMQTVLHAVINKPGTYRGFSANYSGHGFTDMRFAFKSMSEQDFGKWVAKVRASGTTLDRTTYDQLNERSRDEPVHYYAAFPADLYTRILNRCVDPGQMCMSQMMAMDARGNHSAHGSHGQDAHSAEPDMQAPAHDAATH